MPRTDNESNLTLDEQLTRAPSKQAVRHIAKETFNGLAAYQENPLPFHKILYAAWRNLREEWLSSW